ncbi:MULTISPECIES: polysaccharide deacetylase family protein [unclassified Lentimicrobium]|uniref:polysaccharide deacetylase family protein n=1 Tax=unclassified Lentimicrobium TaxID=2677434 RepID=UPI001557E94D|nr:MULTISPECIES: polysaccharide deacetylase family protein [unclassified Lentimicrobium]NPD45288.1 polysaccharide deacetylase family protein [Lentimicrobium sp. S6]NPD84412.1 polysaccharide deacetylase family protein [Lentimicrobium sp. L6]
MSNNKKNNGFIETPFEKSTSLYSRLLNYRNINILIFIVFAILIALAAASFTSYYCLIIPIAIYLFIIVLGVVNIRLNFFLPSIQKIEDTSKVLLTFDDGPHPVYTPLVLDLLDQYQAKAIFFVIGKQAEEAPLLLEEIKSRGHIIGCHTYSHHHLFDIFSEKKMLAEVEKTNKLIEQIAGEKTQFFRPPFGITNPRIANLIKKSGMKSVAWSFRSFDGSRRTNEVILKSIKNKIKGGEILLFHDNRLRTIALLQQALPWLSEHFDLNPNKL